MGLLGLGARDWARVVGIQNAELELGGPRTGHRNAELELGGPRVGGNRQREQNSNPGARHL